MVHSIFHISNISILYSASSMPYWLSIWKWHILILGKVLISLWGRAFEKFCLPTRNCHLLPLRNFAPYCSKTLNGSLNSIDHPLSTVCQLLNVPSMCAFDQYIYSAEFLIHMFAEAVTLFSICNIEALCIKMAIAQFLDQLCHLVFASAAKSKVIFLG